MGVFGGLAGESAGTGMEKTGLMVGHIKACLAAYGEAILGWAHAPESKLRVRHDATLTSPVGLTGTSLRGHMQASHATPSARGPTIRSERGKVPACDAPA